MLMDGKPDPYIAPCLRQAHQFVHTIFENMTSCKLTTTLVLNNWTMIVVNNERSLHGTECRKNPTRP